MLFVVVVDNLCEIQLCTAYSIENDEDGRM